LAFHVDPVNGTLTPVSGSPFPVGSAPQGIAVHPSGRFAYVSDFYAGIFPFSVDPATGVLAPLARVASGAGCRSISIECSGKFIYAPCLTGLHGYAIDATNGTLVQIPGSPVSGAGNPFSSATSGTLN
jgi:6-phosphogluconolactonase (cycloisomerase 2 family)